MKKSQTDFIANLSKIKKKIKKKISKIQLGKHHKQILAQREPIKKVVEKTAHPIKREVKDFVKTGISGFDDLLVEGIPRGSSILVAGGAGSGKTIFCLQLLSYHAAHGSKGVYISFEESEERLEQHMNDFGWNPTQLKKAGKLIIQRLSTFDITRSVDALLAKAKGELLIDIEPVILPKDFKPDFIVVDSLTAVASAFVGKDDAYRVYIEQLFKFFEKIGATSFLITETNQIPTVFSQTGVEEFLADGVIVLYSIKRGNIRENAIEILKLRGAQHQKKIVPLRIGNKGIDVYPEQEVFGGIDQNE
ncbi:AAA family ATPase [Candidatus Woesearchaeota archaeon]|nr:AAA family ATPase [Candidatus Woesearchaeota archaeon]